MGISFNSSSFKITDKLGNTKFSLDRRMPHILYNTPGVISIPKILSLDPKAKLVDRSDEFILINNSLINTDDYFVMPFYKVNGGLADSGSTVISGSGSVMVREIIQPSTGLYLGSTIITTIVEPGILKIVCKHKFDRQGYTNITGDDIINIAYRIYYGRFR
jgi:hypothetical protein